MKDKDYTKLVFILLGLALLWWLWRRSQTASTEATPDQVEAPASAVSPELSTWAANPSAFTPASLGNVDINIGNQGLAYLSNEYIPLFGFVGMAQGVMFQ